MGKYHMHNQLALQGKVHRRTGHEGPKVEQRYVRIALLFL